VRGRRRASAERDGLSVRVGLPVDCGYSRLVGLPIALTLLASGVVGVAIGRWWAVIIPVVGLALFYVGLNAGWWGYGVGDAWQIAMAVLMGVGVVGALAGVAARSQIHAVRWSR
jgi:hypothetical protein